MTKPGDPTLVGKYFLVRYYTVLLETPEEIASFYKNESTLTIIEQNTEINSVVTSNAFGPENIKNKLVSSNLRNCTVEFLSVQSQFSQNDGILVFAVGTLHREKIGDTKPFVQSFFLATQPGGYYVLNNICCYVDSEPFPHLLGVHQSQQQINSTLTNGGEISQQNVFVSASQNPVSPIVQPAKTSFATTSVSSSPSKSATAGTPPSSTSSVPVPVPAPTTAPVPATTPATTSTPSPITAPEAIAQETVQSTLSSVSSIPSAVHSSTQASLEVPSTQAKATPTPVPLSGQEPSAPASTPLAAALPTVPAPKAMVVQGPSSTTPSAIAFQSQSQIKAPVTTTVLNSSSGKVAPGELTTNATPSIDKPTSAASAVSAKPGSGPTSTVAPISNAPKSWAQLAGGSSSSVSALAVPTISNAATTSTVPTVPTSVQGVPTAAVQSQNNVNSNLKSSTQNANNINSQQKPNRLSRSDSPAAIYVAHLPESITQEQLKKEFSKYGNVKSVETLQNKDYGFIEFTSSETVKKVLQAGSITVDGKELLVEEKKPKSGRGSRSGGRGGAAVGGVGRGSAVLREKKDKEKVPRKDGSPKPSSPHSQSQQPFQQFQQSKSSTVGSGKSF